MTSTTTGAYANKGGILSPNSNKNPDFYQWNHVMLNYCSSDNWTGDTTVTEGDQTWHFRGKNIAIAMFEDLADERVMGEQTIDEASQVLVAGTSAGGGVCRLATPCGVPPSPRRFPSG